LKSLGVEIVRTPIEAHADSAESQFSIAKKIATDLPDAILVDEVRLCDMPICCAPLFPNGEWGK